MMSEKQINFRNEYRSRIAGWYNGYLHVAVIYAIGFTAMYIYVQNIGNVVWWEWLTSRLLSSSAICLSGSSIHTSCIAIKSRLRPVYVRHTLNHHQFFSDSDMRFMTRKLACDILSSLRARRLYSDVGAGRFSPRLFNFA